MNAPNPKPVVKPSCGMPGCACSDILNHPREIDDFGNLIEQPPRPK